MREILAKEIVTTKDISCDGEPDYSTHPMIYLTMDNNNTVICPYCSKIFIYENKE